MDKELARGIATSRTHCNARQNARARDTQRHTIILDAPAPPAQKPRAPAPVAWRRNGLPHAHLEC
eukprot:11195678-Lingulodinium_polyedra.AAC.1